MDQAISAADANRRFSELLQIVKKGGTVIVTSHRKPVAKIVPVTEDERTVANSRSALFARLRKQRAVDAGRPNARTDRPTRDTALDLIGRLPSDCRFLPVQTLRAKRG